MCAQMTIPPELRIRSLISPDQIPEALSPERRLPEKVLAEQEVNGELSDMEIVSILYNLKGWEGWS